MISGVIVPMYVIFFSQLSIDPIKMFESLGIPVAVMLLLVYVFLAERKDSKEELKQHRIERKEWRESSEDIHAQNREALEELTRAIRHKDL